jgi:AcrR family transcriptional regulator
MSRSQRQKSRTKKEQIVSTGDRLFSRYGLRRVTVEEICREAGVSKVTFYKYFGNKLELFKHIWTGWSDEIYERLQEMERGGASFAERMRAIVEYKVELTSRMNPEFIEDLIQSGHELEKFIVELRENTMKRFLDFVSNAKASGEMRDVRPEFLLAVLNMFGELIKNKDLRRQYPDDVEFIREINDFFFFGIIPCGEQREERS